MIRRETDPDLANRISNEGSVFPTVSYDGRTIDWSPAIDQCVVLSNGEDAVQVFEQREPRIWEVMTIFAPTCRGKRALDTAFEMKAWMLPYADICFGAVPDKLRHAKWFYRKLGGAPVDRLETKTAVYSPKAGETLFAFRSVAAAH